MASKPLGRLEFIPAKALKMLKGLQRIPTPARLRDFDPWLVEKEGIIIVALITDGRNKGTYHVVDGGSRVLYMQGVDPDYPFRCWILEMTELEAARAFLAYNDDSKKPGAFARYAVGVHAGKPQSLAIKAMLDSLRLVASPGRSSFGDTNGHRGEFAAFAAAERIVNRAYGESQDWDLAGATLTWVVHMGRLTYPQHGSPEAAYGHDADLIQALALIASWNPEVIGEEKKEKSLRDATNTWYGPTGAYVEPRQVMRPVHWRQLTAAKGKTSAGSESRGTLMAREIVTNHNRQEHHRPAGVGRLAKG